MNDSISMKFLRTVSASLRHHSKSLETIRCQQVQLAVISVRHSLVCVCDLLNAKI